MRDGWADMDKFEPCYICGDEVDTQCEWCPRVCCMGCVEMTEDGILFCEYCAEIAFEED